MPGDPWSTDADIDEEEDEEDEDEDEEEDEESKEYNPEAFFIVVDLNEISSAGEDATSWLFEAKDAKEAVKKYAEFRENDDNLTTHTCGVVRVSVCEKFRIKSAGFRSAGFRIKKV